MIVMTFREAVLVQRRASHWQAMLLVSLLAACGGGGGGSVPVPEVRLAEAVIGPEGGSLAFTSGPHAGVGLVVPPGAVVAPTRFTIEAAAQNGEVISIFPVYRFAPRNLVFGTLPATVTLRASESLFDPDGTNSAACFTQPEPDAPWSVRFDAVVDPTARTVTATTTRLGDFVAWNGLLHRLMTQTFGVVDPSVATAGDAVGGVPITTPSGSLSLFIGRGSLASFWSSPAADNVLILPGLLGSPVDYLGLQDLIPTLSPTVRNIVVLSYPSGRGVAATANALYDEIAARRQPGFGCSIIGHSLGGLVGRHLLERSADDPQRPGYLETDESFAAIVPHLVLLGVPNAGADLGDQLAASLLPNVPPAEYPLLQAVFDIGYRPDSIVLQMNAAYVDNATRYHVIFGDIGGGTDGVVSVASALALPLFPPETAAQFPAQHDDLHVFAGLNGIAARIGQLLQGP